MHANASRNENLDYEQIAREIVEDATAVDAAEDELYGEAPATSCRRSSRPLRVVAGGCAKPSSASRPSAQMQRIVDRGIQVLIPLYTSRRRPPGATGTAAATTRCAKPSPPTTAASSTASANQ
jgi:hypothetical protein